MSQLFLGQDNRDKCGVCCHPFCLGEGYQSLADLQCRPQAGLVCQGGLPSGFAKGGDEFN